MALLSSAEVGGDVVVRRAGVQFARTLVRAKLSGAARRERRRRDAFYRGVWLTAAEQLDLPARSLGGSLVEIELGSQAMRTSRGQCSLEEPSALDRAGDKPAMHGLLRSLGVPTPRHRVVTLDTLDEAEPMLHGQHGCVVKPARDGSGGRGVTTNVRDVAALRSAAATAAAAAARASRTTRECGGALGRTLGRIGAKLHELQTVPLLVEEQLEGREYRLLYLDGELVDAVRRANPYVVGDGSASVAQLVDRLNERRSTDVVERGGSSVTRDSDMQATLAAQDLGYASVPMPGQRVVLKRAVNEGAIADHVPAADELCPEIVEQAATAATAAGTRFVGVDVIANDPSVPLSSTTGHVLEVNTTPGLAYHYHRQPGQVHVTRAVLERLSAEPVRRGPAAS